MASLRRVVIRLLVFIVYYKHDDSVQDSDAFVSMSAVVGHVSGVT